MEVQCSECGKPFEARRPHQHFCSAKCRSAFHNESMRRGSMILPLLSAWRGGKHGKNKEAASYAFQQICQLMDAWNAQDKSAGRNPLKIVESKMESAWRAVDVL